MNRTILALACLLLPALAAAQLYKWVDKDGKVHYGDQPPPAAATKSVTAPPPGPAGAAAPKAAPPKAGDKSAEKGKVEKKSGLSPEEAKKQAKADAERCAAARQNLEAIASGSRIETVDEKGERTILDDKQVEERRNRAREAVADSCKGT